MNRASDSRWATIDIGLNYGIVNRRFYFSKKKMYGARFVVQYICWLSGIVPLFPLPLRDSRMAVC